MKLQLKQEHLKIVYSGLKILQWKNTSKLMNHENVATILATGGNAMVKSSLFMW